MLFSFLPTAAFLSDSQDFRARFPKIESGFFLTSEFNSIQALNFGILVSLV